jgi:hypothetical protein
VTAVLCSAIELEPRDRAVLDEVLSRWHHWAAQAASTRGFNRRSLVVGEFRVSRQWDDCNGALDAELDSSTMATVDFEVGEMQEPWRSAIHAEARNLSLGVNVFTSPRLPRDATERATVLRDARAMLTRRLSLAGVI